jgi:hypothetical protein
MTRTPEQPDERLLTPDPPRPPGTPEPPDLDVDVEQFERSGSDDRDVPVHADVDEDSATPEPP